ncbi:MAG: hypothetical protein WCO19_04950 [Candidatus Saccharibacteria bacterium]
MFVKLHNDGSFYWNPELEVRFFRDWDSDTSLGCVIMIVVPALAIALLYFVFTSCGSSVLHPSGPNCHDRVSSEYVSGQISDSEYIAKLNSECGENN